MRIIIDIESDEFAELTTTVLASIAARTNRDTAHSCTCGNHHHHHLHHCNELRDSHHRVSTSLIPRHLIDVARRLDRAMQEVNLQVPSPEPEKQPTDYKLKAVDPVDPVESVEPVEPVAESCNTKKHNVLLNNTESAKPTMAKTASKKSTPTPAEPSTAAPVTPATFGRNWEQEEINLLRTCPSDDAARFVYASHYRDARSENAVRQKWYKLNLAGDILRCGDTVTVDGSDGKQGTIQSFTDDRQYVNIGFFGDPATFQTSVDQVKKVSRE